MIASTRTCKHDFKENTEECNLFWWRKDNFSWHWYRREIPATPRVTLKQILMFVTEQVDCAWLERQCLIYQTCTWGWESSSSSAMRGGGVSTEGLCHLLGVQKRRWLHPTKSPGWVGNLGSRVYCCCCLGQRLAHWPGLDVQEGDGHQVVDPDLQ
jgi:hypothetical protein